MPFKNHEEKLIYYRKYYCEHRERLRTQVKASYQKNKEKYREKSKEYYRNHKRELYETHKIWVKSERGKLKIKIWQQNFKLEVLIHYGGSPPKCACCGETNVEFLTIDHINGEGHKQRKTQGLGTQFYYWLKRNNFPEGFRVLCYNCNCGRAKNGGICPHKTGDNINV